MAQITFEPGDVVQLKSGSVAMTVKSVAGDQVDCTWHDSQNKVVEHAYSAAMLQIVPDWPQDPGTWVAGAGKQPADDWRDNPGDLAARAPPRRRQPPDDWRNNPGDLATGALARGKQPTDDWQGDPNELAARAPARRRQPPGDWRENPGDLVAGRKSRRSPRN